MKVVSARYLSYLQLAFMEHIMRYHTKSQVKNSGKSYFLSSDASYIYSTVKQTLETPDVISLHRKIADRRVYKKKFSTQVGVHGTSHAPCHCVTVVFDIRKNKIITAFPTI